MLRTNVPLLICACSILLPAMAMATPAPISSETHKTPVAHSVVYHPDKDKVSIINPVYHPKTDKFVVTDPIYRPGKDRIEIIGLANKK